MCFVTVVTPVSVCLCSGVSALFVLSLCSGVIFMWLGGFFAVLGGSVGRALGCWGGCLGSLVIGVVVWFGGLSFASFLGWVSLGVCPCCGEFQVALFSARLRFLRFDFLAILQWKL